LQDHLWKLYSTTLTIFLYGFSDTSSTLLVARIIFALCRLLHSRFKASLGNRSEVINLLPLLYSLRASAYWFTGAAYRKIRCPRVCTTHELFETRTGCPGSPPPVRSCICNLVRSGYCMLLPSTAQIALVDGLKRHLLCSRQMWAFCSLPVIHYGSLETTGTCQPSWNQDGVRHGFWRLCLDQVGTTKDCCIVSYPLACTKQICASPWIACMSMCKLRPRCSGKWECDAGWIRDEREWGREQECTAIGTRNFKVPIGLMWSHVVSYFTLLPLKCPEVKGLHPHRHHCATPPCCQSSHQTSWISGSINSC